MLVDTSPCEKVLFLFCLIVRKQEGVKFIPAKMQGALWDVLSFE